MPEHDSPRPGRGARAHIIHDGQGEDFDELPPELGESSGPFFNLDIVEQVVIPGDDRRAEIDARPKRSTVKSTSGRLPRQAMYL